MKISKDLKIMLLLCGSAIIFISYRGILHAVTDASHKFTYEIGDKVKVNDATGYVIRHELNLNMFSLTQDTRIENYVIAIENTNETVYVNNTLITKDESDTSN